MHLNPVKNPVKHIATFTLAMCYIVGRWPSILDAWLELDRNSLYAERGFTPELSLIGPIAILLALHLWAGDSLRDEPLWLVLPGAAGVVMLSYHLCFAIIGAFLIGDFHVVFISSFFGMLTVFVFSWFYIAATIITKAIWWPSN